MIKNTIPLTIYLNISHLIKSRKIWIEHFQNFKFLEQNKEF